MAEFRIPLFTLLQDARCWDQLLLFAEQEHSEETVCFIRDVEQLRSLALFAPQLSMQPIRAPRLSIVLPSSTTTSQPLLTAAHDVPAHQQPPSTLRSASSCIVAPASPHRSPAATAHAHEPSRQLDSSIAAYKQTRRFSISTLSASTTSTVQPLPPPSTSHLPAIAPAISNALTLAPITSSLLPQPVALCDSSSVGVNRKILDTVLNIWQRYHPDAEYSILWHPACLRAVKLALAPFIEPSSLAPPPQALLSAAHQWASSVSPLAEPLSSGLLGGAAAAANSLASPAVLGRPGSASSAGGGSAALSTRSTASAATANTARDGAATSAGAGGAGATASTLAVGPNSAHSFGNSLLQRKASDTLASTSNAPSLPSAAAPAHTNGAGGNGGNGGVILSNPATSSALMARRAVSPRFAATTTPGTSGAAPSTASAASSASATAANTGAGRLSTLTRPSSILANRPLTASSAASARTVSCFLFNEQQQIEIDNVAGGVLMRFYASEHYRTLVSQLMDDLASVWCEQVISAAVSPLLLGADAAGIMGGVGGGVGSVGGGSIMVPPPMALPPARSSSVALSSTTSNAGIASRPVTATSTVLDNVPHQRPSLAPRSSSAAAVSLSASQPILSSGSAGAGAAAPAAAGPATATASARVSASPRFMSSHVPPSPGATNAAANSSHAPSSPNAKTAANGGSGAAAAPPPPPTITSSDSSTTSSSSSSAAASTLALVSFSSRSPANLAHPTGGAPSIATPNAANANSSGAPPTQRVGHARQTSVGTLPALTASSSLVSLPPVVAPLSGRTASSNGPLLLPLPRVGVDASGALGSPSASSPAAAVTPGRLAYSSTGLTTSNATPSLHSAAGTIAPLQAVAPLGSATAAAASSSAASAASALASVSSALSHRSPRPLSLSSGSLSVEPTANMPHLSPPTLLTSLPQQGQQAQQGQQPYSSLFQQRPMSPGSPLRFGVVSTPSSRVPRDGAAPPHALDRVASAASAPHPAGATVAAVGTATTATASTNATAHGAPPSSSSATIHASHAPAAPLGPIVPPHELLALQATESALSLSSHSATFQSVSKTEHASDGSMSVSYSSVPTVLRGDTEHGSPRDPREPRAGLHGTSVTHGNHGGHGDASSAAPPPHSSTSSGIFAVLRSGSSSNVVVRTSSSSTGLPSSGPSSSSTSSSSSSSSSSPAITSDHAMNASTNVLDADSRAYAMTAPSEAFAAVAALGTRTTSSPSLTPATTASVAPLSQGAAPPPPSSTSSRGPSVVAPSSAPAASSLAHPTATNSSNKAAMQAMQEATAAVSDRSAMSSILGMAAAIAPDECKENNSAADFGGNVVDGATDADGNSTPTDADADADGTDNNTDADAADANADANADGDSPSTSYAPSDLYAEDGDIAESLDPREPQGPPAFLDPREPRRSAMISGPKAAEMHRRLSMHHPISPNLLPVLGGARPSVVLPALGRESVMGMLGAHSRAGSIFSSQLHSQLGPQMSPTRRGASPVFGATASPKFGSMLPGSRFSLLSTAHAPAALAPVHSTAAFAPSPSLAPAGGAAAPSSSYLAALFMPGSRRGSNAGLAGAGGPNAGAAAAAAAATAGAGSMLQVSPSLLPLSALTRTEPRELKEREIEEASRSGWDIFMANALGAQLFRKLFQQEGHANDFDFCQGVYFFKARCLDQDELNREANKLYSTHLSKGAKRRITAEVSDHIIDPIRVLLEASNHSATAATAATAAHKTASIVVEEEAKTSVEHDAASLAPALLATQQLALSTRRASSLGMLPAVASLNTSTTGSTVPTLVTPRLFDTIESVLNTYLRSIVFPRCLRSPLFKLVCAELRDRYDRAALLSASADAAAAAAAAAAATAGTSMMLGSLSATTGTSLFGNVMNANGGGYGVAAGGVHPSVAGLGLSGVAGSAAGGAAAASHPNGRLSSMHVGASIAGAGANDKRGRISKANSSNPSSPVSFSPYSASPHGSPAHTPRLFDEPISDLEIQLGQPALLNAFKQFCFEEGVETPIMFYLDAQAYVALARDGAPHDQLLACARSIYERYLRPGSELDAQLTARQRMSLYVSLFPSNGGGASEHGHVGYPINGYFFRECVDRVLDVIRESIFPRFTQSALYDRLSVVSVPVPIVAGPVRA